MKNINNFKGYILECAALIILSIKGYRLLQYRYKNKFGEIDMIVKKGHALIAVEIKYRSSLALAAQAIEAKQQQNIKRTFEYYMQSKAYKNDMRIDVMLFYPYKYLHIKNAF